MSALSATIAIRRYIAHHPEADPEQAIISIRRLDADSAASDFETALELHAVLPAQLSFDDARSGLRQSLSHLIDYNRPWWITGLSYGRERFIALLERDEAQCFRAAGLLDEPATDEIVEWWDHLAQTVRAELEDRLLLQGREAERLSLAHERRRLTALGIAREPRWVAIEDNGAGYDILSYDIGSVEPTSRLIEVKSSTQHPPRIILTRNEWQAAVEFGEVYVFHIWTLPANTLIERRPSQIAPHIPSDQGFGKWNAVDIEIG